MIKKIDWDQNLLNELVINNSVIPKKTNEKLTKIDKLDTDTDISIFSSNGLYPIFENNLLAMVKYHNDPINDKMCDCMNSPI